MTTLWVGDQLVQAYYSAQQNVPFVGKLIAVLWIIQLSNFLLGYRLNMLGIYPRHILGLGGIFFSPCLHAGFGHLFANTIPFFILTNSLLLYGISNFCYVSIAIALLGGMATWIFGRKALHVGASGVIMGYWSYLLVYAYQDPSIVSILLGFVCIYYLGGMIGNVFPTELKMSWEGHFFGFLAGIVAAYYNDYVAYLVNILLNFIN